MKSITEPLVTQIDVRPTSNVAEQSTLRPDKWPQRQQPGGVLAAAKRERQEADIAEARAAPCRQNCKPRSNRAQLAEDYVRAARVAEMRAEMLLHAFQSDARGNE